MKLRMFALLVLSVISNLCIASEFSLHSKSMKANGTLTEEQVFNGFGCSGKNISPDLYWTHAPAEAKSFAVTVYDPDAPTGSGWWHWTVVNIPASVKGISKGASLKTKMPSGSLEAWTDFGAPGFGGACPPAGDKPHRYIFTVYALKSEKLELDKDAPGAMVGYFINQNKIAEASLTVMYGRK